VATGPKSGIFVLDVDGPEGEQALVALEQRHGPLPDLYPMQWTGGGRGGWQAFFAWPEGRTIRNSAGRLVLYRNVHCPVPPGHLYRERLSRPERPGNRGLEP
jgi:hypothetical protein